MKTRATIVLGLGLSSLALAQEHTIEIKPTKGQTLRTKIESSSETTSSTVMLINGEERGGGGGRGGFGGGGERTTSSESTVEFDEQVLALGDNGMPTKVLRTYNTLASTMTMPGREGEDMEIESTGALEGKKVWIAADGDGVVAREDGEDGEEIDERMVRGLRVRSDVAGLLPAKALEVGAEYDLAATLRTALENLNHPMMADRGEAGAGDAGGAGGRGGRGGQGGQRMGGMMGARPNPGLQMLMNEELELEATGKLESVENGKATIRFKASAEGEGAPEAFAGGFGGRGGRGGRGGQGGGEAPPVDGTSTMEVEVNGRIVIDLQSKRLVSLEMEGEFASQSEMTMTREGRDGETMDIERTSESTGTFEYKISVGERKAD